jgi:predicted RNase H-like nuclease (RuvC/YqgF family)
MEPLTLLVTAVIGALSALTLLVTAVIGALSALIGALVAIRKLPAERDQSEATTAATWTDAQSVVILNLREENKQLRIRLDTYEAAMEILEILQERYREAQQRDREMQKRIWEVEQQNKWLVRENTTLRSALEEAGIDVPEFRPQP